MRQEANNRRKQCGILSHLCELSFIARRSALHTQNLPRKPCAVSSLSVFFVSRPPHPEPSQKTMWLFIFFLSRASHPRTFPENKFFCEATFARRTFPANNVASHIFWVNHATFTPRPFAENHVAFQVFLRTPSHPKPSPKTTWRFTLFCKATFSPRTYPQNHVAFHFFLCVGLRTKNLPRKPCSVSNFLRADLRAMNLPRKPCAVSTFFL